MTELTSDKKNYIILQNSSQNKGLTIHASTYIITKEVPNTSSTNNDVSLNDYFIEQYSDKYKHRIFLSQTIVSTGSTRQDNHCCFITQNNIKNNIKFIHDVSNTNRKILFIQNQDISDNSYNYLINNIESETYPIFYHLNYYFNKITNNKDYFSINIKDFIYSDLCNNSTINYANTRFMISNISTRRSTPLPISNSGTIDYKSSDFTTLFTDNKVNANPINSYSDVSINKFNKDISYSLYSNIYSYNKLTLDFTNINSYTFSLYNNNSTNPYNVYNYGPSPNTSNTFNTFMIKTNNFAILNKIKANSKIYVNKNDIYLLNVKTLDICSNFYANNSVYKKTTDLSNTIFLSLGKQITGITQYDIYNNIHIIPKNKIVFDISKIIFKKNINSSLITSANAKYNALVPDASNLYLLDFTFDSYNSTSNNRYINSSDYSNNIINYNNNINYNNILYNYVEYKNKKVFDLNISKIIDFSYTSTYSNNYYNNNVNNLININNKRPDYASISYEVFNNALQFKLKNIDFDRNYRLNKLSELSSNFYTSTIDFDLRFNYGVTFVMTLDINILLNNNILDLCNNYPFNENSNYSKLNFYNLQVINLFTTTTGSDFENVDCILVYHDPATETDERFLYPNNNIEIIKDPTIDTLEKAIVLLPGARTSTQNSTFIPARNGSNLSQKMIEGLIGLNNIPKLLSITPYDPNFINGRGFINQYRVEDDCKNYQDLVYTKINANKHYSAKDNATTTTNSLRNINFANVVRSNARNRLSQSCIDNLRENTATRQNIILNSPVVTPFKLFVRK
jgi:hypothetical protein